MKLGYFVQGSADEAFVRGLALRFCENPTFAKGVFRGYSKESLRRELKKTLQGLYQYENCNYVVVLIDSDEENWRDISRREWGKVPTEYQHLTILGVPNRNIECSLALDRSALARELGCEESEIPTDDPSDFIKSRLRRQSPDKEASRQRIQQFVRTSNLRIWIETSASFATFWDRIWNLSKQPNCRCEIPNERERGNR